MGKAIVPLEGVQALEEARGWEGEIFRQVCEQGQRKAQANREELEEALDKNDQRDGWWQVFGNEYW